MAPDSLEQIDDIRNAISFFEAQPQVDPERIGLWGTSFGGANAPYAAAVDSRVKAVVGQVGFGDGERFMLDVRSYGETGRTDAQAGRGPPPPRLEGAASGSIRSISRCAAHSRANSCRRRSRPCPR